MADQNILDKSMRSVFVGNIPYEATEEKLKDIFNEVGPVISFKLVYDRETGKPKGYGFCEYKDQETALSAMRNLNGYEIGGRTLRVDNACTEKSRLEMQSLMLGMPTSESHYGETVNAEKAPEIINNVVSNLPPEQLFELMKQMKECIQNNPVEARNMLLQNPQLGYALLQAQVIMKIVSPEVAKKMLHPAHKVPAPPQIPKNGPTLRMPALQQIHEKLPQQMPPQMPQPMPQQMHQQMHHQMHQGMPQQLPHQMHHQMHHQLPHQIPHQMPPQMHLQIPHQMNHQMPHQMSHQMPPPMPPPMPPQMPQMPNNNIQWSQSVPPPPENIDWHRHMNRGGHDHLRQPPNQMQFPPPLNSMQVETPRPFSGYPRPSITDSVDNQPFGDMYRGNNSFMTIPPPMRMPPPMTLPPPMTTSSLPKGPPPTLIAELARISQCNQSQQVSDNETTSDAEKAALIMQVLQITDAQLATLSPDQRKSILTLKERIVISAQRSM